MPSDETAIPLVGGSGARRPPAEKVDAEFLRSAERDAVIRDRQFGERCCGVFLGFGVAAAIGVVLGVIAAVDTTGSLAAWQIGLGAALCALSVCVIPCVYKPGLPKPMAMPRASPVALTGATSRGQTLPYRSTRVETLATTLSYPAGTATTLREMWALASAQHADRPAMGHRVEKSRYTAVRRTRVEGGPDVVKKFRRKVLENGFTFIDYREADNRVRVLSRGINALLGKYAPDGGPRHAAVFAASSVEWHLTAQACFRAAVPLATVYSTLGKDGLAYAVNLTHAAVLFVEGDTLGTVAAVAADGAVLEAGTAEEREVDLSGVRCVVLFSDESGPDVDPAAVEKLRTRPEARGGPVEVMSIGELMERGSTISAEPAAPSPDDTAVIMFTSGSTGLPKGVMVLHRNLVAVCAGLGGSLPGLSCEDTWLAYLPSSHILELAAELCFVSAGASLGFGSPFTLTSASPTIPQPGDEDEAGRKQSHDVVGDTLALRPTIMAAVPAVITRIRKAVTATIAKASTLRRWLATHAIATGCAAYESGTGTPFFDGLVFDPLRKRVLGGRVRIMASGGGPLSADAQVWMNVTMRAPLRQGYGLTETCGGGTLQWADDRATENVGPPILSNDIKLVDWEEGGYSSTDPKPRGEVCISGGNVTAGYYEEPEKTAEAFCEEEGRIWFHTGDIGEFEPDGTLRIIDRKKDLVKLDKGEYISLGKMEAIYNNVPGVANIICYGHASKGNSVALAIVDEPSLPEELRRPSEGAYIGDAAVAAHILAGIKAKAKEARITNRGEIPAKVYVGGSTPWLPPSGLVTASLKLQRKKIDRYYAGAYAFMYGDGPDPAAELTAAAPAQV